VAGLDGGLSAAGPFALALIFGGLAFLAWSVLWHGGVVRWWFGTGNGAAQVPLAEILGHGFAWWWRFVRLAVVAVTVTASMLAAIWIPLKPLIRSAGTTGDGGRSGVLLVAGLVLTATVLVGCWLATLHGAWLLGESGRRSAAVAWLRGVGATLRQPIRSLWTLALWAVPGFALLVLPVLLEGPAAWLALLPAWLGSAFCWVALYLSFVPKKLPRARSVSPLEPPSAYMTGCLSVLLPLPDPGSGGRERSNVPTCNVLTVTRRLSAFSVRPPRLSAGSRRRRA